MNTVADAVKGNEKVYLKIVGRNKMNDCDCRAETYYEGTAKNIPEKLLTCEVLEIGYSYGSRCSCIIIPYLEK